MLKPTKAKNEPISKWERPATVQNHHPRIGNRTDQLAVFSAVLLILIVFQSPYSNLRDIPLRVPFKDLASGNLT